MFRFIGTFFILISLFSLFGFIPAHAAQSETFQQWLEKYGAWDRLENEYAKNTDKDSPTAILKRATVYLNLNSPDKSLEIIEMTPSFDNNATEAERLWIGGQAHRALGDLQKSVLWFTQATKFINNSKEKRRYFNQENNLENVWQDVWLKMYWSYEANHTLSRDTQKDALNQVAEVGRSIWGGSYWGKVENIINPLNSNSTTQKILPQTIELSPDGLPLPLSSITRTNKPSPEPWLLPPLKISMKHTPIWLQFHNLRCTLFGLPSSSSLKTEKLRTTSNHLLTATI